MKTKRLKRTRAIAQVGAIALFVAALVYSLTANVFVHPRGGRDTGFGSVILTAVNDFSISGTISDSSSTQHAAVLLPGAPRYFWYTVHNPLHAQIKVLDLNMALDATYALHAGCDASNLNLTGVHLTGTEASPVVAVNALSSGTAVAPISMVNKTGPTGNQDSCKNATFHFRYSGTARYTEVYNTSTALASSLNPSTVGNPVVYSATVTGIVGSGQDPLPNGPTGTVSFKDGATTICPNVALTVGATSSTATCVSPVYSLPSSHTITAVYTNGDANFTNSQGSTTQVVNLPAGCSGTYNTIIGNPSSPTIKGTNGNDYIYAFGANYTIDAGQGSDCVVAGDGNNKITAGNKNNVIVAGNGTNTIAAGNGDNRITVGNGSGNKITAGNGGNRVVLGTGANNTVTLGNGANTITIQTPGNHDTVTVGNGKNSANLGGGTFNRFNGGKKNNNTCHLPSLPGSTYNDTLVNCTAVTP